MRKVEKELRAEVDMYRQSAQVCFELYKEEEAENKRLRETISDLKMLVAKEADTDIVKYNGKLYRIVSTQHCKSDGEETLDISLVPVSEVG